MPCILVHHCFFFGQLGYCIQFCCGLWLWQKPLSRMPVAVCTEFRASTNGCMVIGPGLNVLWASCTAGLKECLHICMPIVSARPLHLAHPVLVSLAGAVARGLYAMHANCMQLAFCFFVFEGGWGWHP